MANTITNSHGKSVLHLDTTDTAITLAELTATDEATVTGAKIVDIFWNCASNASVKIDRNDVDVHTFTGSGHWNLSQAGTCLSGNNAHDIGITFTNDAYAIIIIHKLH